jgi:cell fate regulator YaaT (PSP1 superfamily)
MKREHETMIKSRQLAADLRLNMKIGDVEYQGDGTKAIFYYIADERVDFRQLIKVLAESFRIRIEMKQIGARQEAGRIGGIGPCGRELCCSAWMSSFSSVTTIAARYQEISMNPQKLAGQCSKLKCCLNYEIDSYCDEQRTFPPKYSLHTEEGEYSYIKSDVFKRTYWYSLNSKAPSGQIGVPVERVKMIIDMNRRGQKPMKLLDAIQYELKKENVEHTYSNVVGQDSLTRFDKPKSDGARKRPFPKRRGQHAGQTNDGENRNATSRPEAPRNENAQQNRDNRSNRGNKPYKGNRNFNQPKGERRGGNNDKPTSQP